MNILSLLDGIVTSFGVLLGPLIESFDSNRSTVSWIGSLMNGAYHLSGPIVSWLIQRFGLRTVNISGALIASTGLFLSTFSPNIIVLMLVYGIIGGKKTINKGVVMKK